MARIQIARGIFSSLLALFIAAVAFGQASDSADASSSLWQLRPVSVGDDLFGVAVATFPSGPQFVAVGANGAVVTSPDGQTWTKQPAPTGETLNAITYDGPTVGFIAVGSHGIILASPDGETWHAEISPTALQLNSVDGQFAVGARGVGLLTRSPDGTWTQSDPGFADRDMYRIRGDYAVGQSGALFHNTGVGWESLASGTDKNLYGVATAPFTVDLLSVGADGAGVGATAPTLDDVVPFTGKTLSLSTLQHRVAFGEYVAVGANGAIYRRAFPAFEIASTVAGWTRDVSPTTATLHGVAMSAGTGMVAVGEHGTILYHAPTPPQVTQGPIFSASTNSATAQVAADGAWSYVWVQQTAGAAIPIGTAYPTQSLDHLPFPLAGYTPSLVVANAFGLMVADVMAVPIDGAGTATRLVNVSARARAGGPDGVLIGGMSIGGTQPHRILARAVGPTLRQFAVSAPLDRPRLSLRESDGTEFPLAGQNDADVAAAALAVGAFPLAPNQGDVAVLETLAPSTYTAQVSGAGSSSGTVLFEAYDADPGPGLLNLSARAHVGRGDDVLIVGFTLVGGAPRHLLIRAAGPSLTRYGVGDALPRPHFQLRAHDGTLQTEAAAGAWRLQSDANAIRAAGDVVHAFPFDPDAADAAALVTLPPGSWTIVVSDEDGTSGTALAEVYDAGE